MTSKEKYLDRKQLIMIAVLLVGAALSVINQTSVSPMLPVIMGELEVTSSTAQWLVSGYSLVTAVVIPVTAYLMKRFTTRAVFFVSIGFFTIGSLLCVVAPVFAVLMIGRICQAICAGMLMPLATNIMLLVFPPERRGTAMGIYSLITSLMPAIGPTAAGGLTDTVGWRFVYVIMMIIALAIMIFAIFSLKNYGETERTALDVPSVTLSALGLVALLYGISSIGESGLSILSIGLIAASILIIAAFVLRQNKLAQPVLNMKVFRYRRFVIGLIAVMLVMLVSSAGAVTLPLIIQQGLGQSATMTGIATLPASTVGAITALVSGRLFDRVGGRPLAIIGSAVMFGAYVAGVFMVESVGVLWIAVMVIFGNIGMMFVNTPLNAWSLGFLPDELIPHGNAMSNTLRQVAMSISTALFVTVMAVAASTTPDPATSAAVVFGGRVAFAVQALLCVVIFGVVVAFVRPGEEAEFKAAEPVDPAIGRARDFMRINAPFLMANSSVRDAMALFTREGITDSPVVDEKGRVLAFLSSRDIINLLVEHKIMTPDLGGWSEVGDNETLTMRLAEIIDHNVMGIATKNVIKIHADDSFEQVCTLLASRHIKKVPVVEDGRLVGTVNRDDVVGHIMNILAKTGI